MSYGLKKAKLNQILYVPSMVLFPQRRSHWTRCEFSPGRVVAIGTVKATGETAVKVQYYNTFRGIEYDADGVATPIGDLKEKWFRISECCGFKKDQLDNPRYSYVNTIPEVP